ncbi:MAG TPA: methyltransferase domain-containing protein [Anaeromyxobacteraceae bacterium]|nr:methyltransferase domain-containing protein [Anaeromyxobacteraceae bacterium]
MGFEVAAEGYDRFIGRYSRALAPRFADFAVASGGPVLDVGCGPGALLAELAGRVGAAQVAGVDPSPPFVAAARARVPGADVRLGAGEALPFGDGAFAAALSQLVVAFVKDADRVAAEMRRVVRPGGAVAFAMFAHDGFELVRTYWKAALAFEGKAPDDARLPFRRLPELVGLCERAGLREVASTEIPLEAAYAGFDDLWVPFSLGIGPTGEHLVAQPPARQAQLREACFELLGRPEGPFTLKARVLAVRGTVDG